MYEWPFTEFTDQSSPTTVRQHRLRTFWAHLDWRHRSQENFGLRRRPNRITRLIPSNYQDNPATVREYPSRTSLDGRYRSQGNVGLQRRPNRITRPVIPNYNWYERTETLDEESDIPVQGVFPLPEFTMSLPRPVATIRQPSKPSKCKQHGRGKKQHKSSSPTPQNATGNRFIQYSSNSRDFPINFVNAEHSRSGCSIHSNNAEYRNNLSMDNTVHKTNLQTYPCIQSNSEDASLRNNNINIGFLSKDTSNMKDNIWTPSTENYEVTRETHEPLQKNEISVMDNDSARNEMIITEFDNSVPPIPCTQLDIDDTRNENSNPKSFEELVEAMGSNIKPNDHNTNLSDFTLGEVDDTKFVPNFSDDLELLNFFSEYTSDPIITDTIWTSITENYEVTTERHEPLQRNERSVMDYSRARNKMIITEFNNSIPPIPSTQQDIDDTCNENENLKSIKEIVEAKRSNIKHNDQNANLSDFTITEVEDPKNVLNFFDDLEFLDFISKDTSDSIIKDTIPTSTTENHECLQKKKMTNYQIINQTGHELNTYEPQLTNEVTDTGLEIDSIEPLSHDHVLSAGEKTSENSGVELPKPQTESDKKYPNYLYDQMEYNMKYNTNISTNNIDSFHLDSLDTLDWAYTSNYYPDDFKLNEVTDTSLAIDSVEPLSHDHVLSTGGKTSENSGEELKKQQNVSDKKYSNYLYDQMEYNMKYNTNISTNNIDSFHLDSLDTLEWADKSNYDPDDFKLNASESEDMNLASVNNYLLDEPSECPQNSNSDYCIDEHNFYKFAPNQVSNEPDFISPVNDQYKDDEYKHE